MKKAFVDTGAWYALVDEADPDHNRTVECMREYRGRLVTSNYVFDETLTLVRYKLGWQIARRLGEQLRGGRLARVEWISAKDEETAWSIFSRYSDKSFSFTDCTSFALVRRLALPVCLAINEDFRAFGLLCLPVLDS